MIMDFEKRKFPNQHTHPVFLSTIGALLGLDIKSIAECKVLEINCGDGGNIIPVSLYYPQMTYLGVDTDETAVKQAAKLVKDLQLKNIQVLKLDWDEINGLEGQFDFIILNRTISWIAPSIRRKIWEFCAAHLTENGILFFDFNSLPGWAELLAVRKLIQYRLQGMDDFETAKSEIKKFLPAFSRLINPPENANTFTEFFKDEVNQILSLIDSDREPVFFEDFLGKENNPLFLAQLLHEAETFGLKFLSNCDLSNADRSELPGNVLQLLQNKSRDLVEFEQYIDFFTNQTYREVLLCRKSVEVNRTPDFERLKNFQVKARFTIKKGMETESSKDEIILSSESGQAVKINGVMLAEVTDRLIQNEASFMSLNDLFAQIDELQGEDHESITKRTELAMFLLSLYINTDLLDMRVWEIPEAEKTQKTFKISQLTKIQAERSEFVTNPEHYSVSLLLHEKRVLLELPPVILEEDLLKKLSELNEKETDFREDIQNHYGFESKDDGILQKTILKNMIKKGLIQGQVN